MTIDATGYLLGLLTLGMSMIAARHRNMLLTLGATALWVTLLNFILANTTAGLGWLSLFIISAFTFMAAFALIFIMQRHYSASEQGRGPSGGETEAPMGMGSGRTTMMEESMEEYRARVRKALHPRRRR